VQVCGGRALPPAVLDEKVVEAGALEALAVEIVGDGVALLTCSLDQS
jgi:hypothetical protein